jgi:hypothetical protein
MTFGTITLNGVTDAQMAKILDFKSQHETDIRAEMGNYGQLGTQSAQLHSNVQLLWQSDATLKLVLAFVQTLVP